jgi:hypothetical protein
MFRIAMVLRKPYEYPYSALFPHYLVKGRRVVPK